MTTSNHEVTQLLLRMQSGDTEASDLLMSLVYAQLHDLAAHYMRAERTDHTLQPTALVHEAFLRLVDQRNTTWQNRAHFLGVAGQAMRRILVDHARRRNAAKRDAGVRVTLDEDIAEPGGERSLDLVALDEALTRLGQINERQARVVELRFFAGLDVEHTAEALGISPATVKRDWTFARAWLWRELARA